ncbi:transporter [Methylocucumis oryzae]|uniref:Protein MgtC n=1 Tax=Methylocucumis oryzae TaxID=1632867 RepID=A0A0F3IEK5_9GAMM|nr:transporter [Methylocucumis oryzae]
MIRDVTAQFGDLLPLIAAYILAIPIAWNRERLGHSAGLRTFPLVALASCGFIEAAEITMQMEREAMARVVEGVVTGIGFIGGGAILQKHGDVRGTATAASLWVTAAIGIACGLGAFPVAVFLSLLTLFTLVVMPTVKSTLGHEDQS